MTQQKVDLLHLIQRTVTNEPDVVLLAGRCVHEDSKVIIYPKPEGDLPAFIVKRQDLLEDPIDVSVDLEPYAQTQVQAVKLRKGTRVVLRQEGQEKEIELTPEPGREGSCSLAQSSGSEREITYCIILAEFSCFTGQYLGWCFGFWSCP